MRRCLLTAAVAVILAAGPALAGQDGETHVYGPDGRYEGRATEDWANPQQRSMYDAKGRYAGRVMTDPGTGESRVYDQYGKYLGRSSGDKMPSPAKP
jgi:hypothetical protein